MTPAERFATWGYQGVATRLAGRSSSTFAVIAVFDHPQGVVIVRPGYQDMHGSSPPRAHKLEATTYDSDNEIVIDRDTDIVAIAPVTDDADREAQDDIATWLRWLDEKGRTPEQERARLVAEVAGFYPEGQKPTA